MDQTVKRACDAVGGVAAAAQILGVLPSAIYQWEKCPPGRVLQLEEMTQGAGKMVSRYELRPDIFGSSPPSAAE